MSRNWLNKASWDLSSERPCEEPAGNDNRQLSVDYYRELLKSASEKLLSPFFEDYRRVSLSIPLRSQKEKTQVFSLDDENFVRTRLSHSYEVATCGSKILEEFFVRIEGRETNKNSAQPEDSEELRMSLGYVLMSACLLHDVGNPPFGHMGESIIGEWFQANRDLCTSSDGNSVGTSEITEEEYQDLCSYEGNANSLRMALNSSCMYDGRRLNLTKATISALVKYPWGSNELKNGKRVKKYNFFHSDYNRIEALLSRGDKSSLLNRQRHPLSFFLEAADDISYITADFEDAFRMRRFTVSEAIAYMLEYLKNTSVENTASKKNVNFSFAQVFSLALIAGKESDVETCYRWQKDQNIDPWINESLTPYTDSNFEYLRNEAGEYTEHTFRGALARLKKANASFSAYDIHQLQETYVARWASLAREWFCFSSANSLADSLDGLVEVQGADKLEGIEKKLFGDHFATIEAMRSVMAHYVYDSYESLRENSHSKTVLEGLLNRFVPVVCECVNHGIDFVSLDGNVNPALKATIRLIPLRYRLDFQDRCSSGTVNGASDKQPSCKYEALMMLLDFISSMSDSHAISLYQRLLV